MWHRVKEISMLPFFLNMIPRFNALFTYVLQDNMTLNSAELQQKKSLWNYSKVLRYTGFLIRSENT